MKKVSTQNLNLLPKPNELKSICKSLSTLEAILCPDWEFRYFSYNKAWSETEEVCEMRDGEGSQMLILFSPHGIVINGFAHESTMNGWNKITLDRGNTPSKMEQGKKKPAKKVVTQKVWKGVLDTLPAIFHDFIYGEPIKSIGTTFCIWSTPEKNKWEIGKIEFPSNNYLDGSKDLLALLDGKPETYQEWAMEYYELENIDLDLITSIYLQAPITKDIVYQLNSEFEDFEMLKTNLDEIGFNHNL